MQSIVTVRYNGKSITSKKTIRNELHFNAQLKYRANVFVNRKARSKNGYIKHKGGSLYE